MRVALLMLVLLVAACGPATATVEGPAASTPEAPTAEQPTAVPPTEAAMAPTAAATTPVTIELATCEELIAKAEKDGIDAELAVGMYAGILKGVLDGEPVNGEAIKLTDAERGVYRAALDSITQGDTYCGIVPIK